MLFFFDVVKVATEHRGADAILENLANVNLASDLSLVADYGRIAVGPVLSLKAVTSSLPLSVLPLTAGNFFMYCRLIARRGRPISEHEVKVTTHF